MKLHLIKRVQSMILAIMMVTLLVLPISVFASADNPDVRQARNGVLQVFLTYEKQNGELVYMQGGTAFLVNDSTVVTCDHVITPKLSQGDEEQMVAQFGENYKDRLRIKVVVMRDMYIDATVKTSSAETDFAVLSLASPIYDRTPLAIGNSDDMSQTSSVFALGFPGVVTQAGDTTFNTFTVEDVTVESGTITKIMTMDGTDMLQNNAKISLGNSGGPLVNENGAVVGVNQGVTEEGYYYSIAINQVARAMDAFGVAYNQGNSVEAEKDSVSSISESSKKSSSVPESSTTAEVDRSELAAVIADAKLKIVDGYTQTSADAFKQAVDDAILIRDKDTATQDEVDAAIASVRTAETGLTEKSGLNLIWVIAAILVFVVVVTFVVVLFVNSNKKKQTPVIIPPNNIIPLPNESRKEPKVEIPPAVFGGDGSGETTVLSTPSGETSVLGGRQIGVLVRKSNGERIVIDRPDFIIGKERQKVNYYIPDNSSISRTHAKITFQNGMVYITDLNTTNFTYINDKKIASNQETLLSNGDKVKISDEEFEFQAF